MAYISTGITYSMYLTQEARRNLVISSGTTSGELFTIKYLTFNDLDINYVNDLKNEIIVPDISGDAQDCIESFAKCYKHVGTISTSSATDSLSSNTVNANQNQNPNNQIVNGGNATNGFTLPPNIVGQQQQNGRGGAGSANTSATTSATTSAVTNSLENNSSNYQVYEQTDCADCISSNIVSIEITLDYDTVNKQSLDQFEIATGVNFLVLPMLEGDPCGGIFTPEFPTNTQEFLTFEEWIDWYVDYMNNALYLGNNEISLPISGGSQNYDTVYPYTFFHYSKINSNTIRLEFDVQYWYEQFYRDSIRGLQTNLSYNFRTLRRNPSRICELDFCVLTEVVTASTNAFSSSTPLVVVGPPIVVDQSNNAGTGPGNGQGRPPSESTTTGSPNSNPSNQNPNPTNTLPPQPPPGGVVLPPNNAGTGPGNGQGRPPSEATATGNTNNTIFNTFNLPKKTTIIPVNTVVKGLECCDKINLIKPKIVDCYPSYYYYMYVKETYGKDLKIQFRDFDLCDLESFNICR